MSHSTNHAAAHPFNDYLRDPHALESDTVLLQPIQAEHTAGLQRACADGKLWELVITSVPAPEQVAQYIQTAHYMQAQGSRIAFAVFDKRQQRIVGSTSYHDIVPDINRLEIGYTWYAQSVQRTHINTTCKLLLLTHAFEAMQADVVGWRTDILNHNSQRAIERLGAKKDGVLRHHKRRKDGSVRDTVMYSMLASEWGEAKSTLQARFKHPTPSPC